MSPKKLSPSLLAALGLAACTDGCAPEDLPLVGGLFGDDGDDPDGTRVGPCLEIPPPHVGPCLSPPPVGPCLEAPMVDTGPCLEIEMPVPVVAPVPVDPCLKIVQEPRVGPCLKVPQPSAQPCLDFVVPSQPSPPSPPPGAPEEGALRTPRQDVLARLVDSGVLPDDVRDRLSPHDRQDRDP